MIEPTEGRVVWYHPAKNDIQLFDQYKGQHFAAIVCAVHSNTLVNLFVVGHNGYPFPRPDVFLAQDDKLRPTDGSAFAEWMPYQKGQAAKAEAAQQKAQPVAR